MEKSKTCYTDKNADMTCIDCKYWDEVMRKGHLKYRCINDASVYYMHDTGAVQHCAEFEKM